MAINFTLNGKSVSADVESDTPLLWVVRENFKLTGSKFGCGSGLCGACTVHVNGEAVRSCIRPILTVAGKSVTTIEGLGTPDDMHPVQEEWAAKSVPQCGYCQSGQVMTAAAFLEKTPAPTEAQVDKAMAGNICRCGCYVRIKEAVMAASKRPKGMARVTDAAATAEASS